MLMPRMRINWTCAICMLLALITVSTRASDKDQSAMAQPQSICEVVKKLHPTMKLRVVLKATYESDGIHFFLLTDKDCPKVVVLYDEAEDILKDGSYGSFEVLVHKNLYPAAPPKIDIVAEGVLSKRTIEATALMKRHQAFVFKVTKHLNSNLTE